MNHLQLDRCESLLNAIKEKYDRKKIEIILLVQAAEVSIKQIREGQADKIAILQEQVESIEYWATSPEIRKRSANL